MASFRDLGFARVDTDREARQGAPEGIMAEGKTPAEVAAIALALLEGGAGSVMATRADEAARAAFLEAIPEASVDDRARLAWVARNVPPVHGLVTIVSAGTSDPRRWAAASWINPESKVSTAMTASRAIPCLRTTRWAS